MSAAIIAVTRGKREVLERVRVSRVVVLVLSMDGCGPCRVLKDAIKRLNGDFQDVTYLDCNVNTSAENEAFADEDKDLVGFPTVYVYINGELVDKDADFSNIKGVVSDAVARYHACM